MKVIFVISLIAAAVTAVPTRNVLPFREVLELSPRIISGEPAVLGQFPWQVINEFSTIFGSAFCGGALINTRWVLTAAHCADGVTNFKITLGSLYSDGRKEPQAKVVATKKGIVHPDYNSFLIINDLALIDLMTNVEQTDYIKSIPLGSNNLESDVKLTVSGWGKTSDLSNVLSLKLNFVSLTTISNSMCKAVYGSSINDGTLCCVGAPEHSTCSGDSGGPLVQFDQNGQAQHVGVVSFGHVEGCSKGKPSGYARTEYYRDWILSTAQPN